MRCYELAVGFSCDEHTDDDDGMVHFQVIRSNIRPQEFEYNTLPIETFSSRTGEWRQSLLTSPSNLSLVTFSICNVVGGIFHWQAREGTYETTFNGTYITAYDPNLEKDHLWLIRLPTNGWDMGKSRALGYTSDGRLQCAFGDLDGFYVWVLNKKPSSYSFSSIIPDKEWSLRYFVSYKTLSTKYPKIIDLNDGDNQKKPIDRCFSKQPLLMAFHPQNFNLVYLRFRCKIFIYDLETKRVQLVQYHGTAFPDGDHDLFPYFQPTWLSSLPPLV